MMRKRRSRSNAACLLLMMLLHLCSSQVVRGSLPPGTECIPILTELEPCLPFVQYAGEKPTSLCCSVLKDVHNKSAKCLCRLIAAEKNQPPTPGINLTLAFLLPDACHMKVNPNRCPALLSGDPPSSSVDPGGVPSSSSSSISDSSSPVINPNSSSPLRLWSSGFMFFLLCLLRTLL